MKTQYKQCEACGCRVAVELSEIETDAARLQFDDCGFIGDLSKDLALRLAQRLISLGYSCDVSRDSRADRKHSDNCDGDHYCVRANT